MDQEFDFDLFVIGGGSAGVTAAKTAAQFGKRVALADYVTPSPHGTHWGLGGTCINVGCIPKKLFHYSATFGEAKQDIYASGWNIDQKATHEWTRMTEGVHKYIRSLRWNARNVLAENGIERFDGIAKFIDQHTIEVFLPKNKSTKKITAKFILISTGGRPSYPPNILNAKELAITSDDIFYLEKNPGKTLIIGASYIALETAGFLKGFGNNVTVLVRSILLRGFDQGCAAKIGDYMKHRGINFVFKANITNLEKTEDDKRKVTYQLDDGTTQTDTFDTVLFAIGRNANTVNLNLESAGVKVNPNNQKVIVNNADESSTPHIFALGDVADGRPELTPPAVMAGKILANRLFGGSNDIMDYKFVATTVFTPLEYGSVGYSEEDAVKTYGKENVSAYHGAFNPLEWVFNEQHPEDSCYIKVVTLKNHQEKVIGLHYVGPNAGEVIQGFAVAVRMGVLKKDLEKTVGIHPTSAEELLQIDIPSDHKIEHGAGCKNCGF